MTSKKTTSENAQNHVSDNRNRLVFYIAKFASLFSPQNMAKTFGSELARRYALQSVSRDILPKERVSECMRSIAPLAASVDIHGGDNRAYYRNLKVCGSVWVCPVCAAKITERRRKEVKQGIENWSKTGGFVAMVTYTMSHTINDTLAANLAVLRDSRRFYKSGKKWQAIQKFWGIKGTISALEITWGKNGWHAHVHEILFIDRAAWKQSTQLIGLQTELDRHWRKSLQKHGGKGLSGIACKLTLADKKIADYVAKIGAQDELPKTWGIAEEITKYPAKTGKTKDSVTGQGLLFLAYQGESYASDLFREFAIATKGKSQLHWSKGLADLVGLADIRDDLEVAQSELEELPLLASLTPAHWRKVLQSDNAAGNRGRILAIAKSGNRQELTDYLATFGIAENKTSDTGFDEWYSSLDD